MFDLTNRIALVTGATGGIGNAVTRRLHQQGATVAISGTRESVLKELADSLQDRVHIFPCNLGDKEAVENLIPTIEAQLGRLDILINNAGITRDTLAMRMKDDDWETVIDINLTSIFRLCRSAIKGMMKRRYGRIINISSVVGFTGNSGQCNYTAAKAGIIGMSKSLATELASRGITVNSIAPGFIESAMTEGLSDTIKETILNKIPMGKMGTPDDIAHGVAFLAADETNYMTGQTLHINGGMAMY
jgi:3-oxoacyl-[acyl-carrier protein] reductase